MNLFQAFKMAFKSIAMKKTRSFLTMLGIIIGVASVVIMVSVVAGQNKQQMAYMEMMGNNMVEVNASSWTGQDMDQVINDYVATLGNNLVVGIYRDGGYGRQQNQCVRIPVVRLVGGYLRAAV